METTNKSIESFNELLFEKKHKEYGAYAIRKSYSDNVTRALFITSLFFGLLALTLVTLNKGEDKIPDTSGNIPPIDSLIIIPFDMTPPDEPKEEEHQKNEDKKPKSDIINYKPVDKADETDIKTKTNEEAKIVAGGEEKGIDSARYNEVPDRIFVKKPDPVDLNPLEWVDEMPEFYGNLRKFIIERVRYPQIAKENGTEGTVGISFVVETDGSIGNIKIINAIGDGCTEEAVRVVKLMPKWKPGKNKGQPVRVVFTIPVKFVLK